MRAARTMDGKSAEFNELIPLDVFRIVMHHAMWGLEQQLFRSLKSPGGISINWVDAPETSFLEFESLLEFD